MTELDNHRAEKDRFFATDEKSPLTADQKSGFKGLKYFPENPSLCLVLTVEEFEQKDPVEIPTTRGSVQAHVRYGRFRFVVEGQPAELILYADEDGFFLPFVDALSGRETYGAGRYLKPVPLGQGQFLVDFNRAFNPYCAYNDRWSCPLPPAENRLRIPIRAGEKKYRE